MFLTYHLVNRGKSDLYSIKMSGTVFQVWYKLFLDIIHGKAKGEKDKLENIKIIITLYEMSY